MQATTRLFAVLVAAMAFWLSGFLPAQALQIGERAPDFSMPSTTGKQMALSDFRGKQMVLLEFYHADFGPT